MADKHKNEEIKNVDVEPLSDDDLESAAGGAAAGPSDWCSWDDCSNSDADQFQSER